MACVHPFLFAAPRKETDSPVNVAWTRDHEANSQLEKALFREGFSAGISILNFPAEQRRFDLLPVESLYAVDLPFLKKGDVLVQSTRPPLSEAIQDDKKKVEPSNTNLERATFIHWLRYLRYCSRSQIILRDEVAELLPHGYRNRQKMNFHQLGCRYKYLQEPKRRKSRPNSLGERTAAFLLRVDEIYPGGPGLVAAWGLNAMTTLAWCRLIRHKYSYLLENRGLSMVELTPGKVPARPMTYGFTDDWHVEVLLETGVEMPPRPEEENVAISL